MSVNAGVNAAVIASGIAAAFAATAASSAAVCMAIAAVYTAWGGFGVNAGAAGIGIGAGIGIAIVPLRRSCRMSFTCSALSFAGHGKAGGLGTTAPGSKRGSVANR